MPLTVDGVYKKFQEADADNNEYLDIEEFTKFFKGILDADEGDIEKIFTKMCQDAGCLGEPGIMGQLEYKQVYKQLIMNKREFYKKDDKGNVIREKVETPDPDDPDGNPMVAFLPTEDEEAILDWLWEYGGWQDDDAEEENNWAVMEDQGDLDDMADDLFAAEGGIDAVDYSMFSENANLGGGSGKSAADFDKEQKIAKAKAAKEAKLAAKAGRGRGAKRGAARGRGRARGAAAGRGRAGRGRARGKVAVRGRGGVKRGRGRARGTSGASKLAGRGRGTAGRGRGRVKKIGVGLKKPAGLRAKAGAKSPGAKSPALRKAPAGKKLVAKKAPAAGAKKITPGAKIEATGGKYAGVKGVTEKFLASKKKWGCKLENGKKVLLEAGQIKLL